MKTFYFTFNLLHPLRNHWIEIQAEDAELARDEMFRHFGMNWAFQYEDADFKPGMFPGGRSGRVLEVI